MTTQTSEATPAVEIGPSRSQEELADHPSTAAIAGHPLHPMLVTLPVGLLAATTASDIAGSLTGDRFWARASRWLLRGALASGAVAGVMGATDFLTIGAARKPAGFAHGIGNLGVMGLSLASLAVRRGERDRIPGLALVLSAVSAGMLLVTGWLGGEMSYRQGIGVVPLDER